jgi:hypothetical protein
LDTSHPDPPDRRKKSAPEKFDGYDPAVLSASAGALAAVALLAGLLPARRAAQIDPMRALRYE